MESFAFWLLTLTITVINSQSNYDWCPQYHLIRSKNTLDPSGPIYYNNIWHVFEDSCEWCHYYSTDLIHWKSLNATGFTGLTGSITTTISSNGIPNFIALFPAQNQSGIMRAISTDNMLNKWDITGMVMKRPTSIINNSINFRDPMRPLTINGNIYTTVGSGVAPNGPGMLLFYKSNNTDLTQWQLLGSLFNVSKTYGCIDTKTIIYNATDIRNINTIECPDVFLIDDKYVVITGLGNKDMIINENGNLDATLKCYTNEYWVGNIDTNKNVFNPLSDNNHGLLDFGNFYAAKTGTIYSGVNGMVRRILFGFTGWREPTAPSECGRSHVIPREITLNNKNMLNFNPIQEIQSLRSDSDNIQKGSELQLILTCDLINDQLPNNGNLSVNILVSNDNLQYLQIGYTFDGNGNFYVDQTKCCGDKNDIIQIIPFNKEYVLMENGLYFNILLDRSIVESFFNQQKVITSMVTPSDTTSPDDRGIYFKNIMTSYFDCSLQSWKLTL